MIKAGIAWLRSRFEHQDDDHPWQWLGVVTFAAAICLATVALVVLGYVATREWQRGTDLVVERRAAEAIALASGAVNRDMKGAWTTLIVPVNKLSIEEDPPYNLLQPIARAFARFPYPESFIVWKANGSPDGTIYSFNRTDRRPTWDVGPASNDPFPVVLSKNPPALREAIAALRQRAAERPFIFYETTIGGRPYQIVAHLLFAQEAPHPLTGIAAFTVCLDWVRNEYFEPLLTQVARIGGNENALAFSVFDDQGQLVAGARPQLPGSAFSRQFPLLFLDSTMVPFVPERSNDVRVWSVQVTPTQDTALVAALRSARRTFVLLTLAAVISMLALFLTIRAVRTSALLASMRSEFVAMVTHELKTPVAVIRLVGDTLSRERYTSTETIREYAQLLSQEATRLSRTIDQLLLYAKHSNSTTGAQATLVPTDVRDLVDGALEQFRPRLETLGFALIVDLPGDLPRVRADRLAMVHVMENLIDNAIKYSADERLLRITARAADNRVRITFSDRGIGIPSEDVPHIFERFYRGRNAQEVGSGLGLAIAQRVVHSHGGSIGVESAIATGTHVNVVLMAVQRA